MKEHARRQKCTPDCQNWIASWFQILDNYANWVKKVRSILFRRLTQKKWKPRKRTVQKALRSLYYGHINFPFGFKDTSFHYFVEGELGITDCRCQNSREVQFAHKKIMLSLQKCTFAATKCAFVAANAYLMRQLGFLCCSRTPINIVPAKGQLWSGETSCFPSVQWLIFSNAKVQTWDCKRSFRQRQICLPFLHRLMVKDGVNFTNQNQYFFSPMFVIVVRLNIL